MNGWDAIRYEYRINPNDPCMVQVRPQREEGGQFAGWSRYMARETPADALRILAMLNEPQGEKMVLP